MSEQESMKLLYNLRDEVDAYIRDLIDRHINHQKDLLYYSLGWIDEKFQPLKVYSGKRIRPALCLLTFEAISGNREKAVPLAASIELFHTFTIVHDDIMDRDEERRGVATLWKIWGDGIALTAGDSLFSLAFTALRDIPSVSDETHLRLYEGLADTGIHLGTGQHLDLVFESTKSVHPEMYLQMISGKTVALIEFATHSAALLSMTDNYTVEHLRSFGRNLGFAFQIRDDYLNIWGESYKSKKTAYGDLIRKKKTFPIVYAFNNVDSESQMIIEKIYADSKTEMTFSEQSLILEILNNVEAQDYTFKQVNHYITEALGALGKVSFRDDVAYERLIMLTNYLLGREL